MRRLLPTVPLLLALAAAGCGGDDGESEEFRVDGRTLTIYSSLPRSGDSAAQAEAVAAGQRQALRDVNGRVGGFRVRLVELDASEPDDRSWDPEVVLENAERAADDDTTIAYLGELEYGGSAVSVPVTNEKGVLQVSPLDGVTSLTNSQLGPQGGSERYYPREPRNFLRLVPMDRTQARVLVGWAKERGASRIAVAHDDRLFGRELATEVVAAAGRARMQVTAVEEIRASADGYESEVEALGEGEPQAVIYTGMSGDAPAPLLAALARAMPRATLYASSGIANTRVPDASFDFTAPDFPAREYPRSGRRVLAQLGGDPPVEALFGYESMDLVLDALRDAGARANDREEVVRRALGARRRRGVIGTYDVDPGGDVSVTRLATYRSDRGRVRFLGERDPGPAPPVPERE